jgi:hypothetical protein
MKIFEFQDSNFMKDRKRKVVMKTDPVELEIKLYIKKSMNDELTLDNVYLSKVPEMIEKTIDLPVTNDWSVYEPNEYTKVRLISNKAWK